MGSSSARVRRSLPVDESVMVNVATPYQHVSFSLSESGLSIEWPRSILGVIPVRIDHLDLDLPDVSSIRLTHTVIPTRLAVAIGFLSLLLIVDLPPFAAALTLILGIWFLLLSVVGAVEVIHTRGRSLIPVCLLQRRSVEEFVSQVWATAGLERSER
jgi:hypothetical protein